MLLLTAALAQDLQAERTYRDQHLRRDANHLTVGLHVGGLGTVKTVPSWTVYDGGGASYNAIEFAAKVGDTSTYLLATRNKKINIWTGVGLLIASPLLAQWGNASLEWAIDHPTAPEFQRVVNQGYSLYVLSSASLLSGAITLYVGHRKRMHMEPYYTPEQADAFILQYNDLLGQRLEIDDQTAWEIENGTH